MNRFLVASIFILVCALSALAQQSESRPLTEVVTAPDAAGAPAIEARLLTTVLNGSDDSPVTNVKLVIRNVSPNFYTYVSGWATFYDSAGVRCGEGLFKIDALAVNESAASDTPGLRLRCSPASWRIAATNLLTRAADVAKTPEAETAVAEPERPAPQNFIINVDGQDFPIQVNNPIVLKLGTRNRTIVLRSAP
ncbi:MAG TPA: hypothetical protein VJT71_00950 [Pyrinomonadaceae bacterium]|nr:hypothetical protein [Pyrinomonadaceae bacterium]